MAENEVKKMKILVKTVTLSDKTTQRGGKMYNIGFEVGGMGNRAVTFSETIAAELEKFIDKEIEVDMETRMFNGMPSYSIKAAGDVKASGFGARGGGYQKDVISIERQQAAKLAMELMGITGDHSKKPIEDWKKFAGEIYVWISARPTEAQASGGSTAQKTEIDMGAPIDLAEIPFD